MSSKVQIRLAEREDTPQILQFIRELAEYEQLAHEVVATEASLEHSLFGARPFAEALIAEVQQQQGKQAAGFALFYHNFSTFLGRPGIYLEDLFVRPRFRGQGIGRKLLAQLAAVAGERDCGRLEWWVLDWNQPAIDFYRKLGAKAMDDWTVFRVTGQALESLAGEVSSD